MFRTWSRLLGRSWRGGENVADVTLLATEIVDSQLRIHDGLLNTPSVRWVAGGGVLPGDDPSVRVDVIMVRSVGLSERLG